jgi:hypothetical protein
MGGMEARAGRVWGLMIRVGQAAELTRRVGL